MIHNLTKAEWDAFASAHALQDVVWEQDGDENGVGSRSSVEQRKALSRAYTKIRQLAPETK